MDSGPPSSTPSSGIVSCVEFGPQYQCSNLIAYGTSDSRLCVKVCTIDEDELRSVSNLAQALNFDTILDIPINTAVSRINSLSWSPESAYAADAASVYIRLAVVGSNDRLYLLSYNGEDSTLTEMNIGHTRAINDIAFHPLDERTLASVGDDCTCRIWDVEMGVVASSFRLLSQGTSVCFNSLEPQQVMVTEKGGRIRFYNLSTKQPIRSLECPQSPMLQADWSVTNSSRVGAVAGNSWFCWDVSQSSLPCGVGVAHSTHTSGFKWCKTSDNVFSTLSSSGQFKIYHYGHQNVSVSHDVPVANDMSWHPKLPIVALATSKRISFWGVET